jgi:hypothetical protein
MSSTNITEIALLFSFMNVVAVGIATGLLYHQIKSNHDWNRRRTSHDLISGADTAAFRRWRNRLELKINIYDPTQHYRTHNLCDADKLTLESILNYLENLSVAVKNNVVTESIMFDALSSVVIAYVRWARPYISECQKIDIGFWSELESLAERWKTWEAKRTEPRPIPGKKPLW